MPKLNTRFLEAGLICVAKIVTVNVACLDENENSISITQIRFEDDMLVGHSCKLIYRKSFRRRKFC